MTVLTSPQWFKLPPHPHNPTLRVFHTARAEDNVEIHVNGGGKNLEGVYFNAQAEEWVVAIQGEDECIPLSEVCGPMLKYGAQEYSVLDFPPSPIMVLHDGQQREVFGILCRGGELYLELYDPRGGVYVTHESYCEPHLR